MSKKISQIRRSNLTIFINKQLKHGPQIFHQVSGRLPRFTAMYILTDILDPRRNIQALASASNDINLLALVAHSADSPPSRNKSIEFITHRVKLVNLSICVLDSRTPFFNEETLISYRHVEITALIPLAL